MTPNHRPPPVTELEPGTRVAVRGGIPRRYGIHALADVASVNARTVTVVMCTDGARYLVSAAELKARHAQPLEGPVAGQLELEWAVPVDPAPAVIVVPCSAGKVGWPAPAGELYTGGMHRMAMRAARALAGPATAVLILSARYGLLDADSTVLLDPYDERLAGSVTPAEALALALNADRLELPRNGEVVALTPAAYTARVLAVWPDAVTPLAGCAGIGYQRQTLRRIAEGADR